MVVSGNGREWVLLNASPDVSFQLASSPSLYRKTRSLRESPVCAVVLSDGEMDHVAGLLSLREHGSLRLICTRPVRRLITSSFPLLPTLEKYCRVQHSEFPAAIAGLRISALELPTDKAPRYSAKSPAAGEVVGLLLESPRKNKSVAYLPALPGITEELKQWVSRVDCIILDGTFWSDREMIEAGLSRRTARAMGHVPISGRAGSLEWLRGLPIPRKIYTHINNTNPILRPGSRESRAVARAGVEISRDGMELSV